MSIVDLVGREREDAVVMLLAMAQIHRQAEDALLRAPSIADEYAGSENFKLWAYQRQGTVVGLIGIEQAGPGAAIIRDLAVAPEARRRGVGRMLVDYLRSTAGFTSLRGDTLASAVVFYERCGFVAVDHGTMSDGVMRYRFSWRHP